MKSPNKVVTRKLAKILFDQSLIGGRVEAITRIIRGLLAAGVEWDELVLALCNLCVERDELRRARYLHRIFEYERNRRKAGKAVNCGGRA